MGTDGGNASLVQRWDTKAKVDATPAVNITSIPKTQVGHTWTLHSYASGADKIFVSVPMLKVDDAEVSKAADAGGYVQFPTKTTFTFITGDAGEYIWNCEYPCGDGTIADFGNAMSTMSYMSGHLTVKDF